MHGSQVKFRTISSREKLIYKKLIISIKKQDNLSKKNKKAVPKQSFTRTPHQNIPQSMQIVILTLCNLNAWRIDYFEARYDLLPNSKIFFHNNLLNNALQIFTDLFQRKISSSVNLGQTSDFLSENNKLFIRKQSDFRSETIRIAVENSIQRRYKHLTIGS